MPGLHCDDLGHLCFNKQEADASEFLSCGFFLSTALPSPEGGKLSCEKVKDGLLGV